MAHRMNINQFGLHHPPQPQQHYGWGQPPSWADVERKPNHPGHYHQQQVQPWGQAPQQQHFQSAPQQWAPQQQSKDTDVFSTMGHWAPANKGYQKPPAPPAPVQKQEDVFKNIGEWNTAQSPISIDLCAPTPLPTFPSYPVPHRANSFESATTSPTASLASTEEREKNSWKTIEAMINLPPSRSPSVAEEVDIFFPPSDGLWSNSNLYN